LLSIARRCSREHLSQNSLVLPFSTDVLHVSGGSSPGAVVPQKSQVAATAPPYARTRRTPGSLERLPGARLSSTLPTLSSVEPTLPSDGAGQRETRLLGCALGTAGQPPGQHELMPTSQFTRLSQARGYLRSGEIFIH
jgi:hypothetical protein